MTARTRVEAADAVVSVQAEGVDQATAKIKEVDKALGKLPGAAKTADAAAEDSGKRWTELAGKVGAAVGAFAAVQGLQLDTTQGLLGLAGVAATATAAMGPLGLVITAAGAAVNLLSKAMEDSGPSSDMFLGQLERISDAARQTVTDVDALERLTGSWMGSLTGDKAEEAIANAGRLRAIEAEQKELVAGRIADQAKLAEGERLAAAGRLTDLSLLPELTKLETARKDARLAELDAERAAIQVRQEDLALLAKNNAALAGYTETVDAHSKAVAKAAFSWDAYLGKIDQARGAEAALLAELEASEKARADAREREIMAEQAHDVALFQLNQDARRRESAAMLKFFRGTHEADKDRATKAIALANAERDAKFAAAGAIIGSARGIAEAVGASQKVVLGLQGVEYGILAAGETAKAFASAAVFDFWGATQHGFAAAQATVASIMAFRGAGQAGGGGGGSTGAAPTGGGGAASVSAPSQARGNDSREGGTVVMTFDRLARPLTRGDERAVQRGTRRAIASARTAPLRGSGANA